MLVGYTKYYFGCIKVMVAYCLCRACYFGSIKLMGAYCVSSAHNMLLW